MNIQTLVIVLLIFAAFFLIARKGSCCSMKGTDKKDTKDQEKK